MLFRSIVPTSVTSGNVIKQGDVYYGKKSAADITLTLPTGIENAIELPAANKDDLTKNAKVGTNLGTVTADVWVKGAAKVTLSGTGAGTAPTAKIGGFDAPTSVTTTHYVVVDTELYIEASKTSSAVTGAEDTSGDAVTLTNEDAKADGTKRYSYTITGVDVTFTDDNV